MAELRPVRILLIDTYPESISALSMFASEIKNCDLDVIGNELEFLQHNETGPRPDLLIFAHGSIPDSQELFAEIVASHPELYSIAILPEQDLETGKEYRQMGAREGVYRLENYLGNLRHALRDALTHFWGPDVTSTGYLQTLPSGKKILHYNILELAGAGIRTDVYKAEDLNENRLVALKILPPSIATHTVVRKRLAREAIAASQLHHSSIGTVYALEEGEGMAFVAMEYLEGESLAAALRKGPLGMFRLLDIGSQICDALEVSHQAGRIHGNIKPGNIHLPPNGPAKLLDFGLPQKIGPAIPRKGARGIIEISASGIPWDSLFYFSPEQTRGEDPDGRSDLFSIGSLLYLASTDEQPFDGKDAATIVKRIQTDDPVNPSDHQAHLQEEFDGILLHALVKDRAKRLPSGAELRKVLTSLKSRYIPKIEQKPEKKQEPAVEEEVVPLPGKRIMPVLAVFVFVILAIATALFFLVPRKKNPIPIVVLPIQSTGGNELEYLSGGMTDSLIEGFSMLQGLQVIQPVTAFRYAKFADARTAARAVGVSYVLAGRWNDPGKGVLEVQLLHVSKGLVWSNRYNPKTDDLSATRFAIVQEVSQSLNVILDQEQKKFFMVEPSTSLDALNFYRQGRYRYYQRSREDLLSSIRQFDQAIALDPGFAAAYAARSLSYLDLAETTSNSSFYRGAQDSAIRALELQEKLSEGHTVLGAVNLLYLWNLNTAEQELMRAVTLNPSSSRAHSYLAMLYTVRQQPENALAELKIAGSCDPLSSILHTEIIRLLISLQKYDDAIDYAYKHMDQMDPVTANLLLGDAFLGKKAIEEALLAYRRCQDLGSKDVIARIATVLAVDGMRHEGSILLENLLSRSSTVDPDLVAAAYAQLGDRAKAIQWLQASYLARSADLVLLKVDPNFDSLRGDPEFQKLLRLVGI